MVRNLSTPFLEKAQLQAEEAGVQLRLVHSDMRHIPFAEDFDAVINMFSAFGYLESEEEDQKVLVQVQKALKPGGRFLLETVHQTWLARNFQSRGWHIGSGDTIVLEQREWNLLTGRNEATVTTVQPDGTRLEHEHAMRIYTAAELVRMVTEAGLTIDMACGALDGRDLTLDAPRVVLLASK